MQLLRQLNGEVATLEHFVAQIEGKGHSIFRECCVQKRIDLHIEETAWYSPELVRRCHGIHEPVDAIDIVIVFDVVVAGWSR